MEDKVPRSIPSRHRQIIINSVRKQELMQINDSILKCRCTCTQIQIPQPCKCFTKFLFNLRPVFIKILIPAQQSSVVMPSQALEPRATISRRLGMTPPGKIYFFIHGSPGCSSRALIKCRRKTPPGFIALLMHWKKSS